MAAEDNRRAEADLAAHRALGRPVLMDGATGTELERRGIEAGLPLWSTHALRVAPEAVRDVHASYVQAGCDWITANTFRTQRRVLARAGLGDLDAALTRQAVQLAREAHPGGIVLGSAPSLEDCYRPDLVPDDDAVAREQERHVANLGAAGVDAILAETHNTLREARAVVRCAYEQRLPCLVGFVCDEAGSLLSGEPLAEAIEAVARFEPLAVGVNCLPPRAVSACLPALVAGGLPFFVSANLGAPRADGSFERSDEQSPEEFATHGCRFAADGASLVGGCCGTTPAHLEALSRSLSAR